MKIRTLKLGLVAKIRKSERDAFRRAYVFK
jgi:hypothetical protein